MNEPAFQRGFKSFKKKFKKTLENDKTLIRVMFQFARENLQNINVGRKCNMEVRSQYNQLPWQGRHIELWVGV